MRLVFAWMTLALGITAAVALSLDASGASPDLGMCLAALACLLVLVIMLGKRLHVLSPVVAGLALVVYAALCGLALWQVLGGLMHPLQSDAAFKASLSGASLFAWMLLVSWKLPLDLARRRSFAPIAGGGLLCALAIHFVMDGGEFGFDLIFSLAGIALFSGLCANSVKPIEDLAAHAQGQSKPAGRLGFSLLAALQLFLGASQFYLLLLSLAFRRRRVHDDMRAGDFGGQASYYLMASAFMDDAGLDAGGFDGGDMS